MAIFQSKCDTCGLIAYIFPDQVEIIKRNDQLKMHKYVRERLHVGKDWFCIKCDATGKDALNCKIFSEVPSEKAQKLIKIRKRETNLKSQGFVLPQLY